MRALFFAAILVLAACPAPGCDDGLIFQVCDGACRFLPADPENCGGCGIACVTGEICCSGVCLDEAETGKGCI